mmetsp:Transcript_9171/g.18467  ORF Transcript_9171/g.18467 Transcript_9171/m.18467 type:complete len:223 (-) Transcript_9171:562-1230(-)
MLCVSLCAARSISLNVSGFAITGGPSSKIFWNRRCVLQSRPFKATALPCASPTICTSKCLAPWHSCIMNMGLPGTSFCTCTKFTLNSSSLLDMRIPLPPPPSEALSITGYPMRFAAARASSAVVTIALSNTSCGICPWSLSSAVSPSPLHGMLGTPAVCAKMLAAILSPSAAITFELGPMNLMPSASNASGSRGFSEAWPHPGHTASTPLSCAILTITSTLA